jgi:hypothetical protein
MHKGSDATFVVQPLLHLLILAIPVATVTWTVTHEEVFREPREWCQARSERANTLLGRKLYYLLTCEFCFSFYVSGAATALTGFRLLYSGLGGAVVAWLSLVWIANFYMSVYARVRLDIKRERVEIARREKQEREA